MHELIPKESIPTLMLIGAGHERQQGGEMHAGAILNSMYIPAGQRTVRETVDADDSRPSGNLTLIFQTEKGGPS